MDIGVDFDAEDETLTFSSPSFMLRIHATAADLLRLDSAQAARWDRRESLAIGTTVLGRAFWCAGGAPGSVTVLVGHDDETWDLSVDLPSAVVAEVITLAQQTCDGA